MSSGCLSMFSYIIIPTCIHCMDKPKVVRSDLIIPACSLYEQTNTNEVQYNIWTNHTFLGPFRQFQLVPFMDKPNIFSVRSDNSNSLKLWTKQKIRSDLIIPGCILYCNNKPHIVNVSTYCSCIEEVVLCFAIE